MISNEPLLAFSFALSTRNNQLATISDDILDNLDAGISKGFINDAYVTKAGINVWLWTLGAYESIRTMCPTGKNIISEIQRRKLKNNKRQS